MSIQPSQVASIDLSGKPEGATHYSVNRPGACVMDWYKLESGKWKFWGIGRWTSVSGAAPAKEVFEIPARPDWSKGPANATHFGPADGPFHEAFFQLVDGTWLIAHWENDWFWREYRNMGNDRLAMLVERPKGIDWSAAPYWAIGHGLLGDDQTPAWVGKISYRYVGETDLPYNFSSDPDHPLFFHRDDVKGYVERPRQDFASQVQEGIEDAEAGNLVSLDEVKARWESRPSVPRDFSGPVLDHNPDPEPMTPVEYKSVDGTWKPGVYVGRVYGRMVVGCDETEVVGWLDSEEMRPPRTPEQIAADERLHKIRNAATDIASTLEACSKTVAYKDIAATVLEAMIDAGYARPVKA